VQARARLEIEAPPVVGAGQGRPEQLAFDERVALVRALIVDGVDDAVHDEDRDLASRDLDERTSLGIEGRHGKPEPLHAAYSTPPMPLYLREADVERLLTAEDAVAAVEGCFARSARGQVENRPRFRVGLDEGVLNVMAAADLELGVAGLKTYAAFRGGARFLVVFFAADRAELLALIEADRLGRLRTGAASGVAAKYLAREDARTLGLIGTGWQAESQLACIRAALPGIDRVVAYSRTPERLNEFCKRFGAEPAEYNKDAAEQDVVVTVTTSRDPVLRGEWLRPGALVCAAGANRIESRELDNAVLERATFVCCDSKEQARIEAADLVEPVERGVLDWLEVHELAEVVSGEVPGRANPEDIVLFKSLGIAAEDLAVAALVYERARAEGLGEEL
jgi:alanine dehydrogenase